MDCGVLGLYFSFPHPPPSNASFISYTRLYVRAAGSFLAQDPPPPHPPDLAEKNHKAHGSEGSSLLECLCTTEPRPPFTQYHRGRGGGGEDQPHHYSLTRLFTHPVHQYTPQPPIHTSATNTHPSVTNTHLSRQYTPQPPIHSSATNTHCNHQYTPPPPIHT
jgi:hypothetical protein